MEDTQHVWNKAFLEALDHDVWGQVEEACEGYHRLQVAAAVEHVENVLDLPAHRRDAIGNLAVVLKLRIQELNAGTRGVIGLAGMQSLKPFMAGLILKDGSLPPAVAAAVKSSSLAATASDLQQRASVPSVGRAPSARGSNDAVDSIVEVTSRLSITAKPGQQLHHTPSAADGTKGSGTLRPPIPAAELQQGDITLAVNFATWSVKGAIQMVEPHVLVTVRDKAGKLLEAVQESPCVMCHPTDHDKMVLGFTWHMQTAVNCLPEGAAVFFELRHYKKRKQKKSVKCYSYIEASGLRLPGKAVLEVYKKPADFRRKGRLTLLGKDLVLQVDKVVTKH